jgi:hypothetical protein
MDSIKKDFSAALMHCSTIAYFMSKGKEKTPRQLWEEACEKLAEWQAKWDKMDDRLRGMANGKKAALRIVECQAKVDELAVNKDDEPLSKTAKSYLKKYYAYLKYGKWSASLDKGNKYVNKGKLGEPDSIQLVSFLDNRPYLKNADRWEDEFLTGEPDIAYMIDDEIYIIDVKTSWDIETFMDVLGKDLSPLYWWQIQGYFALTGATFGEVSYCLVNTPESILLKEKYYLSERLNSSIDTSVDAEYLRAERELINNMTFDDMPRSDCRIKFMVTRDDEAIQKIYKRVTKCREYLAEIQELHAQGTFAARSDKNEVAEEEGVLA